MAMDAVKKDVLHILYVISETLLQQHPFS